MKSAGPHSEIDEVFEELAAEDLEYAFPQGLDGCGLHQRRAGVPELKSLVRVREAVMRDERSDVRQFSLLRSEELFPRGHVEKQIPHGDRRPAAALNFIAAQNFSTRDFDSRAGLLVRRSSLEQEPG